MASQAQQFKWLEELYPPLFIRVSAKIKSGEFQIIGRSWMENDTNMSIEQRRTEEARQLLLQALEARRSVFGAEHPSTFMTMHNLGWIYNRQGRAEEAEKLYLQVLELTKIVLGVEHPQTSIVSGHAQPRIDIQESRTYEGG